MGLDNRVFDPTRVDTVPQAALGSIAVDGRGNTYIYLQGTANVAVNDFCVYNPVLLSSNVNRGVAASRGPGGFAAAAIPLGSYGWFLIGGRVTATVPAAQTTLAPCYLTATPGNVSSVVTAGQRIEGVYTATSTGGAGTVAVMVTAPPFAASLG